MHENNSLLIGLNKPRGVICSHKDEKGRPCIYDLLPKTIIKEFKSTIHSVGRLDFNSQGLILMTNKPKIKYYLFGCGEKNPSNLEESKKEVSAKIQEISKWLVQDANVRVEKN